MNANTVDNSIHYNSAYISLNLLDELDFCVGGYGKPTVEFIFTLNTFIESFIGCSEFYTSLDELNHLGLTSAAIFPNGRPILNIIAKAAGLKFVSGVVDKPGEVIYRSAIDGKNRKELERDFISQQGKTLKEKYLRPNDIDQPLDRIPLLKSKFSYGDLTIFESSSTSFELVANLVNVSNTSSIQTTLPITLFDRQVTQLAKPLYSIEALNKVAEIHQVKIEQLRKALAYRLMPIPPFTNILLSQVNSTDEIPDKLLQLRTDFHELRTKFIELEKRILEAPTLKEQWEAQKSFDEFWAVFNKKYTGERNRLFYSHLDIFADADVDKGINTMISGDAIAEGMKDINYVKIGLNVLSKITTWNRDRRVINRFKGITSIWDLFENSKGIRDQLPHFERVFKVKFESSHLQRVHEYVKRIKDIQRDY